MAALPLPFLITVRYQVTRTEATNWSKALKVSGAIDADWLQSASNYRVSSATVVEQKIDTDEAILEVVYEFIGR